MVMGVVEMYSRSGREGSICILREREKENSISSPQGLEAQPCRPKLVMNRKAQLIVIE
jgi:hypothetical protein